MSIVIGYLATSLISNSQSNSGTPHFLSKAIEKAGYKVVDISPDMRKLNYLMILKLDPLYFVNRIYERLFNLNRSDLINRPKIIRFLKKAMELNIIEKKPTIIFADKCSWLLSVIDVKIPILYRSDATFKLMENYYPEMINASKLSNQIAANAEVLAFKKITSFMPTSFWAAKSAELDYQFPEEKINVLRSHSSLIFERKSRKKASESDCINFLFIGGDWKRKGGDVALSVLNKIIDSGYKAQLNIISNSVPESVRKNSNVKILPFINRTKQEGIEEYFELFLQNDFFILPTKAECLAQVFIDALMSGLPAISYDTGALSEVIRDNITGLLFNVNSSVDEISERLINVYNDSEKMLYLSENSIKEYEEKFSFDVWSSQFKHQIQKLEIIVS